MPKAKTFHHPMLSELIEEPFNDPDWIFEIKLDGFRAIAEVDCGDVEFYSRNFHSFSERFPDIHKALQSLDFQAVFDGEIVALDENGIPKFQLMQNIQRSSVPISYTIFDLLFYEGRDLRDLPLIERKKILEKVLSKVKSPFLHYLDHIEENGIAFFEACTKHTLEGIIGKRKTSSYLEGNRSHEWVKIKASLRQEAVICGFTEPKGGRKNLGALILGVYQHGELTYVGHVGTGFSEKQLKEIKEKLLPFAQKESPFKVTPRTNTAVTWLKPHFLCEVSFSEWTNEGIMRQPVFLGLREDKPPKQVVREKPTLTNLDKIYYPDLGITKGDVIDYYEKIGKVILPYLKDHPQSLRRFPEGILGHSFFQKNLKSHPSWIETVEVEHHDKVVNYLLIQDLDSLLYAINLGCIELHPFFSKVESLDFPEFLVFDLDPVEIGFDHVVEVALELHDTLDELKCDNFCKTSGGRGMHICVPLRGNYTFEQAKQFAHLIASLVHRKMPKITSLERSPKDRRQRVYIDYLQNNPMQTIVAPYSLRARLGAPVSTPLDWSEVEVGLNPLDFNMATIFQHLEERGDLFKPLLRKAVSIERAINLI